MNARDKKFWFALMRLKFIYVNIQKKDKYSMI